MRLGRVLTLGKLWIFGALLWGPSLAFADMVRDGYIQDIQAEKNEQFYEVYMSPPAVSMNAADIRAKIFNAQLTNEFRDRWDQKFGYIDTDSLSYDADRFTNFNENRNSVQDEQRLNDRRAFGEYMMRRLAEWHMDNYFKSDPSLRAVYEAKEKLSNVQVKVSEQTKVNVNYALADNSVEAKFENPNYDAKLRLEMDPGHFGPTNLYEEWLYFGKRLTKSLYVLGTYAYQDGLAQAEIQRAHSARFSTSWRVSTTTTSGGRSPRQSFFGYALNYLW